LLSDRINNINESETIRIFSEAKNLIREGKDIIDLSAGEPDFPTPQNIKDAAVNAININLTRYTLNSGTIELRKAVSAKLKKENDLDYTPDEIIISTGAKQCLFNAVQTIINPNDEVIIPAPYWVSYPEMVNLANGKPVIINTDENNNFKLKPGQLHSAVTSKTKCLILCNPSSPTGTVYTEEELKSLAEVCRKYDFYIITDEIYEKLVYDNTSFKSFPSLGGMKDRTILINGVSKAYSMTGWRIGYAAASENIIRGMAKIQSHSTSCASSVSQAAALEALEGPQDFIAEMRAEFCNRRNFLFKELTAVRGITCIKPSGAFYLFPNISYYFNKSTEVLKVNNSFDLSMYLLYHAGVAVIPGTAFGAEGYLRISYTASMQKLESAVKRIKKALEDLT
jgi:aspartate aminotransferase